MIKKVLTGVKNALRLSAVVRTYRRIMLRFIIDYLKKNHREGLTSIFSSDPMSDKIIAWKWMWSSDLEKEVKCRR